MRTNLLGLAASEFTTLQTARAYRSFNQRKRNTDREQRDQPERGR